MTRATAIRTNGRFRSADDGPADYLAATWRPGGACHRLPRGQQVTEDGLRSWLEGQDPAEVYRSSLVPPPARRLLRSRCPGPTRSGARCGPRCRSAGVAIPERHAAHGQGAIVSSRNRPQAALSRHSVVYDVNAAKDFVSDYLLRCAARDLERVPYRVHVSRSVGSVKHYRVPAVLCVDVPRWIENDLPHAEIPSRVLSIKLSRRPFDLIAFLVDASAFPSGSYVESV